MRPSSAYTLRSTVARTGNKLRPFSYNFGSARTSDTIVAGIGLYWRNTNFLSYGSDENTATPVVPTFTSGAGASFKFNPGVLADGNSDMANAPFSPIIPSSASVNCTARPEPDDVDIGFDNCGKAPFIMVVYPICSASVPIFCAGLFISVIIPLSGLYTPVGLLHVVSEKG